MALYKVARTDTVGPGEFVHAYVLAAGAALARARVTRFAGVRKDGKNVEATRMDPGKIDALLTVYFDERDSD